MELKKSLVEHMVHLLSCGHVLPVVDYISHCMQMGSLDHSHIRHFVSEVLSVIQRPYSSEFSTAFEPLVHNHEITAPLINSDKSDPVSLFLGMLRSRTLYPYHLKCCGWGGSNGNREVFAN